MGILNYLGITTKVVKSDDDTKDINILLPDVETNSYSSDNAENISVVMSCINILSSTISRLPVNIYKDDGNGGKLVDKNDYRYTIVHYNVNGYMTSQAFFSAIEYNRNYYGNAFARIKRDKNTARVKALELLPNSYITGYKMVRGDLYYVNEKGKSIPATDILHFKGVSKNGVWGLNPTDILKFNLSTTYRGLGTIDKFYKNNANTTKALKSTVSGANQKALLEALKEFKKKYSGMNNAGSILPLPPNTDLVDIPLSLIDVEFINTLKYNKEEIASMFGVPMGLLNSQTGGNIEQELLHFKATTIGAVARMYRQELESKLLTDKERIEGKSIEFNFNSFVETDVKSRAIIYNVMTKIGAMSPNQVASKEGLPTFENGDYHYFQSNNLFPIEMIDQFLEDKAKNNNKQNNTQDDGQEK